MKRAYLEEDLHLIQKYFPGAKALPLRTPFDLTQRDIRQAVAIEASREGEPDEHWYGDLQWTR